MRALNTAGVLVNPLFTGGLFHYNMFDESICHFRGVGSISSTLMDNPVSKQCRP